MQVGSEGITFLHNLSFRTCPLGMVAYLYQICKMSKKLARL